MENQTQVATEKKRIATPSTPVVLSRKKILEDLENGLTRPQIAKKYNVNFSVLHAAFQHDELKGKKTKKDPAKAFVFEEDIQEGAGNTQEAASNAGTSETSDAQVAQEPALEDTGNW